MREPVPHRHGADVRTGRRMASALLWFVRDAEPSPERWEALGQGLLVGDPVADAAASWLEDAGGAGWRAVAKASSGAVDGAPEPLEALLRAALATPSWSDPELERRGARFFQRTGRVAYYVLRDAALMGGYQAAGFNRTLVLTGALENGAARRLAETMRWVMDVTEEGGLDAGRPGFASTLHVRLVHALVRRRVAADPRWDRAALGVPVSQTDMVATWLGFSVVFLLGVRGMGVPVSDDDARAVMALWRRACWLMGVDDGWLTGDEAEGRRLLYQTVIAQLPPDDTSVQLGRALMAEATTQPHPWPRALWAALDRERHLSVSRLFLGRPGMAALGLPTDRMPWFPLVTAPVTLATHLAARALPDGEARLVRRGRAEQVAATAACVAGAQAQKTANAARTSVGEPSTSSIDPEPTLMRSHPVPSG